MLRPTTTLTLAWCVFLGACGDDLGAPCVDDPTSEACMMICEEDPSICEEDSGRVDSGDAGLDGGGDAADVSSDVLDAGLCSPACTPPEVCLAGDCVRCIGNEDCGGDTPYCVENECVACTSATLTEDCDATAPACSAAGACVGCSGDDALCSRFTSTPLCGDDGDCVACNGAADCTLPSLPRCDPSTNTCTTCMVDDDCEGTGRPACALAGPSAGTCVACTEGSAPRDCGDFSCNPATNTCTTTERDSVPDCGRCMGDDECMGPDDRCVPMNYMGATRPSGHCLRRASAGCVRPYGITLILAESLSGEPEAMYCGIDQTSTTCDAVRALRTSAECTTGLATECADAGALCQTIGAFDNQCTIPCGAPGQCPTGFTCGGTYCGS